MDTTRKSLTEPQTETPHKYCRTCGNCLVWVSAKRDEPVGRDGKGGRRLSCLLCRARTAIKQLIAEVDRRVNEIDELQAEIIEHEKTCGVLKSGTSTPEKSESVILTTRQRNDFFGGGTNSRL